MNFFLFFFLFIIFFLKLKYDCKYIKIEYDNRTANLLPF